MRSLKKEAIDAISKLPETVSLEEIMYCLIVIDKIRKGRAATDRGESISIEHLQREMESW